MVVWRKLRLIESMGLRPARFSGGQWSLFCRGLGSRPYDILVRSAPGMLDSKTVRWANIQYCYYSRYCLDGRDARAQYQPVIVFEAYSMAILRWLLVQNKSGRPETEGTLEG